MSTFLPSGCLPKSLICSPFGFSYACRPFSMTTLRGASGSCPVVWRSSDLPSPRLYFPFRSPVSPSSVGVRRLFRPRFCRLGVPAMVFRRTIRCPGIFFAARFSPSFAADSYSLSTKRTTRFVRTAASFPVRRSNDLRLMRVLPEPLYLF